MLSLRKSVLLLSGIGLLLTLLIAMISFSSLHRVFAQTESTDGLTTIYLPVVSSVKEQLRDTAETSESATQLSVSLDDLSNDQQAQAAAVTPCPSCYRIYVDTPFLVDGPNDRTDTPIDMFNTGSGIRGYTGNGSVWKLEGTSADTVSVVGSSILGAPGGSGSFDNCGVWMNAVEKTSTTQIRAWYHAETNCGLASHEKSVGYAESSNNGLSFSYPANNQVIKAGFAINDPAGYSGEGDHGVIIDSGYYYMYLLQANGVFRSIVARATVASGGTPGNWWKYYNGGWAQPGVGGLATPLVINNDFLGLYPMKHVLGGRNHVMLFLPHAWSDPSINLYPGLQLTFGNIPTGPFVRLADPLIPLDGSNWSRPAATELIAYPSGNTLSGSKDFTTHFVMNYLYLQPNEGFDKRYLLRRHVWFEDAGSPQSFNVRLRLARYWNSSKQDHWVTTTYPPSYGSAPEIYLGSLLTRGGTGRTQLNDCYIPVWDDHFVSTASNCIEVSGQNHVKLRTLGWIFSSAQANTDPLYRCFNSSQTNHFLSTSSTCEGKGTQEFLMGYILKWGGGI